MYFGSEFVYTVFDISSHEQTPFQVSAPESVWLRGSTAGNSAVELSLWTTSCGSQLKVKSVFWLFARKPNFPFIHLVNKYHGLLKTASQYLTYVKNLPFWVKNLLSLSNMLV